MEKAPSVLLSPMQLERQLQSFTRGRWHIQDEDKEDKEVCIKGTWIEFESGHEICNILMPTGEHLPQKGAFN